MSKAIVGIGRSAQEVELAVSELQNGALISPSDISVLLPDAGTTPEVGTVRASKAPEGAVTGVVAGGVVGGAVGLLAGIGLLAIPGLGAFIAAGPLLAALSGVAAGATAGGVVGALIGMGIPEYEAKAYEKRLKEGGYLVAVHAPTRENEKVVREILKKHQFEAISAVTEQK